MILSREQARQIDFNGRPDVLALVQAYEGLLNAIEAIADEAVSNPYKYASEALGREW